jgi:hypothetical protein
VAAELNPLIMAKKLLILACGSYSKPLAKLSSAVPDAKRLGALLGKRNVGNFTVTEVMNPTLVQAQVAIHDLLASASIADLTVLYMSGHGVKDSYGRFYLALPETDLASLPATSLSGRFIREQMADTTSRQLIVILDTCFAGAFSRDMVAKSVPLAAGLPDELIDERGHVVMAATSAIQYAFETIEDYPTSLFTKTICDGIESGAADLDADGSISLEDIFNYTAEKMREESRAQTPEISYLGVNAQIPIARTPKRPTSAELEGEVILALNSPHSELRLAAAKVLGAYAKDANRRRSSNARARLRNLRNDESDEVRQVVGSFLGRTCRSRRVTAEFKVRAAPAQGDQWASLDGRALQLAGEQTPRFASFGDDLPVLEMVAVRLSDSNLEIFATDRYRLDWRRRKVLACGEKPFFALISANDFSVLRNLPSEAEVRIDVHDREVYFTVGPSVLTVRRELRYKFPEIDRVIKVAGATCSVRRLAVIEAIESLICDRRMQLGEPIVLRSSAAPKPTLQFSAGAKLRGKEPRITITAKGQVPEMAVQLDYQRVLEGLDTFEQDTIYFCLPRANGPILISNADKDANQRHAIMPMKASEN